MGSLFTRIVLVVSLAVLPAVGFQIYNEIDARGIRGRLIDDEALRLLRLVQSERQRIIEGAEQAIDALRAAPSVQDRHVPFCERLLVNLIRDSPRYKSATVAGPDGHAICEAVPGAPWIDSSDRPWFKSALRSGRLVVGGFEIGRRTGAPVVHFAKAFRDHDGMVAGVVVLSLSLEWLGQRIGEIVLPPRSSAWIADRDGIILARWRDSTRYAGKTLAPDAQAALVGDAVTVVPMRSVEDGRPMVVAYAPSGGDPNGWIVGVALDATTAFATVENANYFGLLLIAAGAGSAVVIAFLLAVRLIRRPFKRLLVAAERLRSGDLTARAGILDDRGEFGRLSAAFDRMAAAQQARERDLRDSEETFRAAFDQAAIGMAKIRPDGGFARVNDKLCAITGYPRDALLGMRFRDLARIDGPGDPRDAAGVARGARPISGEHFFQRKDGRLIWVNVTVSMLRGGDGGAEIMLALIEDISDRKRIEADLRHFTASLETRVREEITAREAAQARAANAERVHALGQLAGGIAHDFNNVLQAVMSATSLIVRKADDEATVRRLARLVTHAAERGASTTRRLLTFGGRADLRAEPLDVPTVLNGLREMLAHGLDSRIDVQVSLEGAPPPLAADRGQLETVLVNLATNARDAMPDGGRLTLSAAAEMVRREAGGSCGGPAGVDLAPGLYVRLTVSDTGCGMDPATLARAGQPFFTTKPVGAGTGLGLPMAIGFAEQSGGGLRIDSHPGKGTVVTLWLPGTAGPAELGTTPGVDGPGVPADPRPRDTAIRVLLVDDETLVRESLAETIQSAGCVVVMAATGAEALAVLAAGVAVDVLVTDLTMPGLDGVAVIEGARRLRPALPAIMLTGYPDSGRATIDASGLAFPVLRKPVDADRLVDAILALGAPCGGTADPPIGDGLLSDQAA